MTPATSTHARRLCWQTVWEAAYDLEADAQWSMEVWHVIGGGAEPSQGVRVQRHPSVSAAHHAWGGTAESEQANTATGGGQSASEDEVVEADVVAPMRSVLPARTAEGTRQQKPAPPMAIALKPQSSSPALGPDPPRTADARASSPSIMRAQLDAAKIQRQGDGGQEVIKTSESIEVPALVTLRSAHTQLRSDSRESNHLSVP